MGGRWSITARNLTDKAWEVCDYNLSFARFVFLGIKCLIKYDVVELGKHG